MKVLIVGLGSIGRRHLRNIKAIDSSINAAVLREHSKEKAVDDDADLIDEVFVTKEDSLKWNADCVVIANPAPYHVETAMFYARQGCHLFLEKPLSIDLEGIDDLIAFCREQGRVLMVGYCLRFLEPLKVLKREIDGGRIGKVMHIHATVGRYLGDWRPSQDYRQTVSANKYLGGGVVLELSHEIDYVRWLTGEVTQINALVGKVSRLDVDVEDVADINLRFENGAFGHIHLDMLDHEANRSCRVIGEKGTIKWESEGNHIVKFFDGLAKKQTVIWSEEGYDYNQMYIDQFVHFFECIKTGQPCLIDGEEGRRVLEIALLAKNPMLQEMQAK